MRQIVSAACGLVMGFSAAAQAEETAAPARAPGTAPVVVELYTSQGCSSCPEADALFAELARDPRVIALALHVDYWDYLGWKDGFGQEAFTKRQKSYARAAGDRMIYTPQLVVGGVERLVGNKREDLEAAVARQAALAARVRLTVTRGADGRIMIRAEAVPPSDSSLRIDIVRYRPEQQVQIERGENAGHSFTYHNIVTSWDTLAVWRATVPFEMAAPDTGSGPLVVIVQADGPAEILAAAALP